MAPDVPRPIEGLTVSDIERHGVWAHIANRPGFVRPVSTTPVKNLNGKLFAAHVKTRSGREFWALIGMLDAEDSVKNELFKQLSVYNGEAWFQLSRYFDWDYEKSGPQALASFLRMPLAEVFPIEYDLSSWIEAEDFVLKGKFLEQPEKHLSRAEIIALAVP